MMAQSWKRLAAAYSMLVRIFGLQHASSRNVYWVSMIILRVVD